MRYSERRNLDNDFKYVRTFELVYNLWRLFIIRFVMYVKTAANKLIFYQTGFRKKSNLLLLGL